MKCFSLIMLLEWVKRGFQRIGHAFAAAAIAVIESIWRPSASNDASASARSHQVLTLLFRPHKKRRQRPTHFKPIFDILEVREMPTASSIYPMPVAAWSAESDTREAISGLAGSSMMVEYVSGIQGQAFGLTQPGSGVLVASNLPIDFERNQPFSITAWAKINRLEGLAGDAAMPIFVKGDFAQGTQSYGLAVRPGNGVLMIDAWLQGSTYENRIYWRGVGPAADMEFHHFAMTYDGTSTVGGVRIYIDGKEIASTYTQNTLTSSSRSTQAAQIGAGFTRNPEKSVSATFDEVRVFGTRLSATEIVGYMEKDRTPLPTLLSVTETNPTAAVIDSVTVTSGTLAIQEGLLFGLQVNGNAIDAVSGQAGTVNGGVNFAEGKSGQALSFTQPGSVSLSSPGLDALDSHTPFTAGAWVKLDSTGNAFTIFEKGGCVENRQSFGMSVRGEAAVLDVWIQGANYTNRLFARIAVSVTLTEWNHFAFVYDGSSRLSGLHLFVNGQEVSSLLHSEDNLTTPTRNSDPLTVGTGYEGNPVAQFTPGRIEDLRIYGLAHSAEQVRATMIAPAQIQPPTAPLVTEQATIEAPSENSFGDSVSSESLLLNSLANAPRLYDPEVAQLGTFPNLRMELEAQAAKLAGLMPTENAADLVRRGYPSIDPNSSNFWSNVSAVAQDMNTAVGMIQGASETAFVEILKVRAGVQSAPGNIAGALFTTNQGVGWVLGMLNINAERVNAAVLQHFDEIYDEAARLKGIEQQTIAEIHDRDVAVELAHQAAQITAINQYMAYVAANGDVSLIEEYTFETQQSFLTEHSDAVAMLNSYSTTDTYSGYAVNETVYLELLDYAQHTSNIVEGIKAISAAEAFGKYDWLKDVPTPNISGNFRGIVINSTARVAYQWTSTFADSIGNVLGLVSFAQEAYQRAPELQQILESPEDPLTKSAKMFAWLGGAIAGTSWNFGTGIVDTSLSILKNTYFVNPVFWWSWLSGNAGDFVSNIDLLREYIRIANTIVNEFTSGNTIYYFIEIKLQE